MLHYQVTQMRTLLVPGSSIRAMVLVFPKSQPLFLPGKLPGTGQRKFFNFRVRAGTVGEDVQDRNNVEGGHGQLHIRDAEDAEPRDLVKSSDTTSQVFDTTSQVLQHNFFIYISFQLPYENIIKNETEDVHEFSVQ